MSRTGAWAQTPTGWASEKERDPESHRVRARNQLALAEAARSIWSVRGISGAEWDVRGGHLAVGLGI